MLTDTLLNTLNKPEYFYRPSQLLWRVVHPNRVRHEQWEVVRLPWGSFLKVNIGEDTGCALWHLGVLDLVLSEALWRLTDRGTQVVDVGANVGYTANLLANRVGPQGEVVAFEPHPMLAEILVINLQTEAKNVRIEQRGVGFEDGVGVLAVPESFSSNQGLSHLRVGEGDGASSGKNISVEVRSLDSYFSRLPPPTLIKVDVEGGEAEVFKGAAKLLQGGQVRDILFEDHFPFPSRSTQQLESWGYKVFRLHRSFWGPKLLDVRNSGGRGIPWLPPNFLATLDEGRAESLLAPRGWRVLRGQSTSNI